MSEKVWSTITIKKIRTKGWTCPREISPFFKFSPDSFFSARSSAVRKANKRLRFLRDQQRRRPKIRRFNRVYRRFKCGLTSAATLAPSQWETGSMVGHRGFFPSSPSTRSWKGRKREHMPRDTGITSGHRKTNALRGDEGIRIKCVCRVYTANWLPLSNGMRDIFVIWRYTSRRCRGSARGIRVSIKKTPVNGLDSAFCSCFPLSVGCDY